MFSAMEHWNTTENQQSDDTIDTIDPTSAHENSILLYKHENNQWM